MYHCIRHSNAYIMTVRLAGCQRRVLEEKQIGQAVFSFCRYDRKIPSRS
jgi:hypothetical protein